VDNNVDDGRVVLAWEGATDLFQVRVELLKGSFLLIDLGDVGNLSKVFRKESVQIYLLLFYFLICFLLFYLHVMLPSWRLLILCLTPKYSSSLFRMDFFN